MRPVASAWLLRRTSGQRSGEQTFISPGRGPWARPPGRGQSLSRADGDKTQAHRDIRKHEEVSP